MTMDFGSASASVCVVVSGSCEMGQSSIQAVKNLEHTYAIPASKIAVTPMIGLNDNSSETFTAADVDTLTSYAEEQRPGRAALLVAGPRHSLRVSHRLRVAHLQLGLRHDRTPVHQPIPRDLGI